MADEQKDNIDPGPPPDPDEINPNAPPTAAPPPKVELQGAKPEDASTQPQTGKLSQKLIVLKKLIHLLMSIKLPKPNVSGLDTLGKLKALTIILLVVFLVVLFFYRGGRWNTFFKDPALYRLDHKATSITRLNPEDGLVEFEHDLLVPQYVVLLKRVVVNLKRSATSGANPMVAFDLYLHATNQEAAVEIKDRERELQDYVQRLTEGFSYDQLLPEAGKKRWKMLLKSELNLVLNKGQIKDIYFNTLLIKP